MSNSEQALTTAEDEGELMSFGEHLEVLRRMLLRIVVVAFGFAMVIFCFKHTTFEILLAPSNSKFVTFTSVERLCAALGWNFRFDSYEVSLINTELSSQFMTHLTMSALLGLLCASPYAVTELFGFISPALYNNEKRYAFVVAVAVYVLFIIGVLMSYFVLFPFAFRFLGTYQVDSRVINQINLDSYIGTFTTLTFLMGVVFQMPVVCYVLAKMGILETSMLSRYRRHAFLIIMFVAAIITPPDILTLIFVTLPMYGLYELSVIIVQRTVQ